MLVEDIDEDEGALWTEGSISCLYIYIGYYRGKSSQVFCGTFCNCGGIGGASSEGGCIIRRFIGSAWLSGCFFVFQQTKLKPKNRTACRTTFYFRLKFMFAN